MDDGDVEGGELGRSSHEKAAGQSNWVGLCLSRWREAAQGGEHAVPDLTHDVGIVAFCFQSLRTIMVCWRSDSKGRQSARAAMNSIHFNIGIITMLKNKPKTNLEELYAKATINSRQSQSVVYKL